MSVNLSSAESSCNSNSAWKCVLAIDSAVCLGLGGSSCSTSGTSDLPTSVEVLTKLEAEDLREGDPCEGPLLPRKEFIDAFLSNVGVAARASRLLEDDVRRTGLCGGALPFGVAIEACLGV